MKNKSVDSLAKWHDKISIEHKKKIAKVRRRMYVNNCLYIFMIFIIIVLYLLMRSR